MANEEATKNVKVKPSLHAELEIESEEREVPMQHVVDVLLRYGLQNADTAFAEWHRNSSERIRRRKQTPTPLHPVSGAVESKSSDEQALKSVP